MSIILNGSTGITTPADTVTGNETVGGTLTVTGATTLNSTLATTGAATVGSTLGVTGATTLSSTLAVTGTSTLTGGATIGGVSVIAVAPGTSGNVLTSNGTAWTSAASSGGAINVQTFTSSGTWTKPSGYAAGSRALIQAWGGGGSGSPPKRNPFPPGTRNCRQSQKFGVKREGPFNTALS